VTFWSLGDIMVMLGSFAYASNLRFFPLFFACGIATTFFAFY
jgi:hypothetical protein